MSAKVGQKVLIKLQVYSSEAENSNSSSAVSEQIKPQLSQKAKMSKFPYISHFCTIFNEKC